MTNKFTEKAVKEAIELARVFTLDGESEIKVDLGLVANVYSTEQIIQLIEKPKKEINIKKLIKQAHFDGQYLHSNKSKLLTKKMLYDNAEYYSNEIIQSLKQPKKINYDK